MARQKTKAEHEVERTAILRLLVEAGFHPLTPGTILAVLHDSYHLVTIEGLDFHLGYLADKGWIKRGDGNAFAQITAAGVEEFDARTRGVRRAG